MSDSEPPKVEVGDHVIYHDPRGRAHNAIVTINWGSCINLVYVSNNADQKDEYGRQIARETSLMHKSAIGVHGNYWRLPSEEPNPYKPPVSN